MALTTIATGAFKTQSFADTEKHRARRFVKPFFLVLAGLLVMTVTVGDIRFTQAAGGLGLLMAATVAAFGIIRRLRNQPPDHFWYSTGFAAAILASMTLGSWWLWDGIAARTLIALAATAAFLAGATSFCVGRFIYVLVFREVNEQSCD